MGDFHQIHNSVNHKYKDLGDGSHAEVVVASGTSNITTKFRDSFESYTAGAKYSETIGTGDLVFVDGNAASSSYLVISKSSLFQGTETRIETNGTFDLPVEVAVGLHMSQRTLGQEFSLELVDTGTPLVKPDDLAIASISQATTILTVTTVLPHKYSVGQSIGIRDVAASALNYPTLVVASVPSPTQFTCTAGPGGTIPSVTMGPATSGFVYVRTRMGGANDGISQIFENATATNSSLYARSASGDVLPSATIAGSHSMTTGSTASAVLASSPFTYAFVPTTEFKFNVQGDRVQWADAAIDSVAQSSNRLLRTQVCPSPDKFYKLRVRAVNSKAMTIPVAQVVTITKTGTTTATVTTDVAHGLSILDVITIYGVRDQANFANLTVATAVASVISPTKFTVVIGTAVTATSFGGYVAKINGGVLTTTLGAIPGAVQSVALSTLVDGTRQLTVTHSTTVSGLVIGDCVDLYAVREATAGTPVGIDGVWKVANVSTTIATLVPIPGATIAAADFAVVNCGGAISRRTDLRISYLRVFDFERERVELLARPAGDISGAAPVSLQNPVVVSSGSVAVTSGVIGPVVPTAYALNSLATTNGALIITGTCGLQSLYATNVGATDAYIKLYNKATAPVVGTDVPVMIITVPAAVGTVPGKAELVPGFAGYRFALGLGIAITGAAPDTDITAVAAGQVKVMLSRTA